MHSTEERNACVEIPLNVNAGNEYRKQDQSRSKKKIQTKSNVSKSIFCVRLAITNTIIGVSYLVI